MSGVVIKAKMKAHAVWSGNPSGKYIYCAILIPSDIAVTSLRNNTPGIAPADRFTCVTTCFLTLPLCYQRAAQGQSHFYNLTVVFNVNYQS